jgi:hypothetical protein
VKVRFQDDVIMGETAEISVEGKLLQGEVLQISPDFKILVAVLPRCRFLKI